MLPRLWRVVRLRLLSGGIIGRRVLMPCARTFIGEVRLVAGDLLVVVPCRLQGDIAAAAGHQTFRFLPWRQIHHGRGGVEKV